MKVCSFLLPQQAQHPKMGLLHEDKAIDINLLWACYYESESRYNFFERANHSFPSSLYQFLKLSENPIQDLQKTLETYKTMVSKGITSFKNKSPFCYDLSEVCLKCPLDKANSLRDFYTHEIHVEKSFQKRKEGIPKAWYEMPVYYKGSVAHLIGPEEEVLWPSYTDRLDYELELAAVMGREGQNISLKKAYDHIFGFTILNDISARDIQAKEMSVRLGPAKGKDFCSVLGPVIVTMDEWKYKEPDLLMTSFINGEKQTSGRSSQARYSFAQMIAHASKDEMVAPWRYFRQWNPWQGLWF